MYPTPSAPLGHPGSMFRDLVQSQGAQQGQGASPFSALQGMRHGPIRDLIGPQLQQLLAARGMGDPEQMRARWQERLAGMNPMLRQLLEQRFGQGMGNRPGMNMGSLLTSLAFRR